MISLSSRACLLGAFAIMACSNGAAVDTTIPASAIKSAPALTTLRVVPEMLAIQPGSTQQLSVLALDQSGAPMDVSAGLTFTTDAPGVAQVNDQGIITGLVSGVARVSAIVKAGLSVKTAQATAFVRDSIAFPDVVLTYGNDGWSPFDASARAGSLVEWRFDPATSGAAAARIYVKNSAGAVIDSVFLRGSPALHQFTAAGSYSYCMSQCGILQSGKVTVH